MGISTVAIGFLPTYDSIGVWAALFARSLPSLGQGLVLAVNGVVQCCSQLKTHPKGKRTWYGMFPQLGAPVGFILATGIFLVLAKLSLKNSFSLSAGAFRSSPVHFWLV